MKRAIINQLGQLSEQLKGYAAALHYRYLNLCVKAEEASLLPIQVPIEDELKNLEDVAFAGKKDGDDYSLYIAPKLQDDMEDIAKAVMMFHPEFIQELEKHMVDPGDGSGEQELHLLRLKMPDVDDNRYDVLKQGVDTFYNMCKADMEKARLEADAQFVALGIDENPKDMDELKKAVDETNEMWAKKRDQLHDEKLKEIEDAHNEWLANQQASAKKKQEENAANNQDAGSSMRLTPEDEE
jgi:hypothetical protein